MGGTKSGRSKPTGAAQLERLRFLSGNLGMLLLWPLAALLIGLAAWAFLMSSLEEDRRTLEARELRTAQVLAQVYSDQLSRTIESIDQIILHVKFEWQLSKGTLKLEDIREIGLFPPTSVFYVGITDRNGIFLTGTLPDDERRSIDQEEYFLMQKKAIGDQLYIGAANFSPIANRNVVRFSHRLLDNEGMFNGIVMVSVALPYFTASYDPATYGRYGLMAIMRGDKMLRVARIGDEVYPPEKKALLDIPDLSTPQGSRLLEGRWFADGRSRYLGWQGVSGYPLIALSGRDQQEAMAPYLTMRRETLEQATWATLALAIFALIGMALSGRLAWRKYQIDLSRATYRMATEEGNEGFYIVRALRNKAGTLVDFKTIDCNQRGAEMFNLRREELIGLRASQLPAGSQYEHLIGAMLQAMTTGSHESEVELEGDGETHRRWMHMKVVRSDGHLAIRLRDVTDTRTHVQELERRGNEDALTGLPNRHWVRNFIPQAIERARENGTELAILFVDLDGFKAVNDTMGHATGDELLKTVARRLKQAVRPHDHVVRLGGDEFVVIIENVAHRADAAHVAERVLDAFREGFRLSQGVHRVGTSIGISIFPQDGQDADTLLKNADIAMYSVKTSGKGDYRFYNESYFEELRARLEKETELRQAIEQERFVMHYQPRVDISTGATSSMEALVRWQHPVKGLLDPLEFVPLAEETGLIIALGEIVIDKVCAQLAHWAQSGQELVPVSINVSPRQFAESDIVRTLATSLAHHHVDARLIEIELTESSMKGNSEEVASRLRAIQGMGIKLLVDDFGTGYSSLSQLQRLDFDMLKVDRSFTAELEKNEQGNVFFTAIVTMAHALGMRVVAEGVETEVQIRMLKALRCDEIQGFYVSKPLPAAASQPVLPRWLFSWTT